jgi:asparagine synthase (glutamine-hydrolysing)
MSGIAGRLHLEPGRHVDRALLQRMSSAIEHRGPDDQGLWCEGAVGLAHRRLKTLDLTDAGRQPMSSEDGTVWVVLDGDILNHGELRQELMVDGYRFRSRSDAEVLLNLYHRDGVECLPRLRGAFAFAIWDTERRELCLARDRVGEKPLCYHADTDGITFASEIKAVLQDRDVDRDPDPVAIHHYLTYQCVPAPLCAFKGIHKLPPGHFLLVRDGRFEVRRYWQLSFLPKARATTERERRDLEAELVQRLDEATALRMGGDVQPGLLLSGGLDSTAVLALMAGHSVAPVRTFTIGFDARARADLTFARRVARHFGADHADGVLPLEPAKLLPRLVWQFDEPFADASALPAWHAAALAGESVPVVLNGAGGDESFAGYERHVANHVADRLAPLQPLLCSRAFQKAVDWLPRGTRPSSSGERIKRFVAQLGREPRVRNAAWLAQFDRETKRQLYSAAFRHWAGPRDAEEMLFARQREAEADNFTDASLYADLTTHLPDTLLARTDLTSMAHSLQARSPFLDHEFMEFAARLPEGMKLANGRSKVALRRALRNIVPKEVFAHRPRPFRAPLDQWLRGELRDLSYDLLLSLRARGRGYFQPHFVERMLREHRLGTRDWHTQIWNLMMLESWHRAFVDGAHRLDLQPA